uniref:Lipoprotein n=1 Tax=Arundo donax TaxID=35708 RepID=A0A0A9DE78_ARUDO
MGAAPFKLPLNYAGISFFLSSFFYPLFGSCSGPSQAFVEPSAKIKFQALKK